MPNIVIGKKRLEHLRKMPLIETSLKKSKDGNYMIHKTTFTSIKPIEYYMSIMESEMESEEEIIVEEEQLEV